MTQRTRVLIELETLAQLERAKRDGLPSFVPMLERRLALAEESNKRLRSSMAEHWTDFVALDELLAEKIDLITEGGKTIEDLEDKLAARGKRLSLAMEKSAEHKIESLKLKRKCARLEGALSDIAARLVESD